MTLLNVVNEFKKGFTFLRNFFSNQFVKEIILLYVKLREGVHIGTLADIQ